MVYSTPRTLKDVSLRFAGGLKLLEYWSWLQPQSTAVKSSKRRSAHHRARLQSSWNCAETCLMVTVVSAGIPCNTRSGSVPKVSFTLSPVSEYVSSVAAKSNVFDVSPALKVTLARHARVVRG